MRLSRIKDLPFNFKQFSVAQANAAMKVGTDAVLLATLPKFKNKQQVLEIGSGTGVISLMLAQQLVAATINALEINPESFLQTFSNFQNSKWSNRLHVAQIDFLEYDSDKQFDLIISNPPYFLNSLLSPNLQKNLARHLEENQLAFWLEKSIKLLAKNGEIAFILPFETALEQGKLEFSGIFLNKRIDIKSFPTGPEIRSILIWSRVEKPLEIESFCIYESPKKHTEGYISLLKDFLTIF